MFGRGKGLIKAGLTFLTLGQIPFVILYIFFLFDIGYGDFSLSQFFKGTWPYLTQIGLCIASFIVIGVASKKNTKYGNGGSIFPSFSTVFLAILVTKIGRMVQIILEIEDEPLFKNHIFLYLFITMVISLFFFVTLLIAKKKTNYALMKLLYFLSHFAILFLALMQISYVLFTIITKYYGDAGLIPNLPFMICSTSELLSLIFIFFASLVFGYSSGFRQMDQFVEQYEAQKKSAQNLEKEQSKPEQKPQTQLSNEEAEIMAILNGTSSYDEAKKENEKEILDTLNEVSVQPIAAKYTCPNCNATFEGQPDECPYCGSKFNWKK